MKRAVWMLCLLFAFAPALPARHARAAEDAYAKLLSRYDALNDEIQHTLNAIEGGRPPPPNRVLSMKRNASVTVGGEVRAAYAFSNGSGYDPSFEPGAPSGRFDAKSGDFSLPTVRLSADVRAGQRWRGYIDINLHGHPGTRRVYGRVNPNAPGAPDPTRDYERVDADDSFINQAYIELMKAGHSGFGAILGKVKLPFGLWKRPNLFTKSFIDSPNLTGSYLNRDGVENALLLPHASRFLDPAVAALLYYEMRDILRFDAAVFQESEEERTFTRRNGTDGVEETRSSELPPLAWQVGASIQPLENWELTAHFRNRHSRTRGVDMWTNSPARWDFRGNLAASGSDPRWDAAAGQWSEGGSGPSFGATRNEQALVIGLAVEIPTTKLSVSAEYAHGWNQGFNRHIHSDGLNVGFAYRLTPDLTLHAQGEWLHVRDGSWMAQTAGGGWARDARNNHLYRAMLGAEYALAPNMVLEAGWQYEYWRAKSSVLGESRLTKANVLYFGTRFVF